MQSASRRPFASVTRRGGLDDFVDLVIPELQQRGLFRTEYEGASSHQTCMELFLSSGCFVGFADRSLFGAGKPFFVPSPAIRFPERAEGVKGPKR